MNPFPILYLMAAAAAPAPPADELPANLRPEYVLMADSADYFIAREIWPEAKRCTLAALRSDPGNFNNSLLLSNLGIINQHLGLRDEAIKNFTLGLDIAPRSTTLRINRARAYLDAGQYENARADLVAIIETEPRHPWALKMLGTIELADRHPDRAQGYLSKIEKPDPDTLRLLAAIASEGGDTLRAREILDRLLSESPSAESYFDHALFCIQTSDIDTAKADIADGIKMYPREGNLILLRAYIHSLMHENELATLDNKLAMEYGADKEWVDILFPDKRKR